ncbi:hypothetical protein [Mycetocola miduiensis]|nr:hypothetical protein [Mycetocola miduiensis]
MQSDTVEMFRSRRVASSRDVEHARQVLGEVFLPVDFPSARKSGNFDMRLNALTEGRLTCGHMLFGDALHIETVPARS